MNNHIIIEYCPRCNWMLRAAWIAQELLVTFENELSLVSLKPSQISGVFIISINEKIIFDRKNYGGFAEPKVIKQMVRDEVAPDKNLGHSEKSNVS